jgi:predicted GIY-YIG superfamily endonuclease
MQTDEAIVVVACPGFTSFVAATIGFTSATRRMSHPASGGNRRGLAANHTALRLPVDLAYTEEFSSLEATIQGERQLKRWSAEKKEQLSKRRKPKARRTV